jgi:acetyltransferase-like isoleucine patch superfamily enzyme
VLCGTVTVGDGAHIGAGAVILQGVTIGAGALVGAGAVVVGDVPAKATVLGNPARFV